MSIRGWGGRDFVSLVVAEVFDIDVVRELLVLEAAQQWHDIDTPLQLVITIYSYHVIFHWVGRQEPDNWLGNIADGDYDDLDIVRFHQPDLRLQ